MPESDHDRLLHLVRSRYPCISIQTAEEEHAYRIAKDVAQDCNLKPVVWSAVRALREARIENEKPVKDTEHPAAALYHMSRQREPHMLIALDLLSHLEEPRTVRALRECIANCADFGSNIVLIDAAGDVPPAISTESARLEISLPEETELAEIAKRTLRGFDGPDNNLNLEITRGDFELLVRNLLGLTRTQAERVIREAVVSDNTFNADDIMGVLDAKRRLVSTSGALDFIDTPADLDEIGGMHNLKRWLAQRVKAFDDDARDMGLLPPRGVLMLGVQGAGKSLTAKAIATAWKRPLLRLDAGSLYDRYIGESERKLRGALSQTEAMAPVILWIDEIEKAFAGAAAHSTDGGLSRRMFGALLTWMQEHTAPVFLVATANDINALPPELLRKGRFDEIFFVDLPDAEVRAKIFEIHLERRKQNPGRFDVPALAQAADGFSGAEIEQAVISGLHESHAQDQPLDTAILLAVIQNSPPLSVTAAEKVGALREWAQGRCVPAN